MHGAKQHSYCYRLPGAFLWQTLADAFDLLAVCNRRTQSSISCKSGTEDVARTNRRALLLSLVAVPGLAQLQPAHAGDSLKFILLLRRH